MSLPTMKTKELNQEIERLILLCEDPLECALTLIGAGLSGLLSGGMSKSQITEILTESVKGL